MNINLKRIGQLGNGLTKPTLEASYAENPYFQIYKRDGLQGASLFAKMQCVLRLLLISLVFAGLTLCSRGDDAVPSVASLVNILAASESQLRNLKVTGQYEQMRWDASSGQWTNTGDASLTVWLDGTPGGKMRIDYQHKRLLWTDGAKPFFEESYIQTYNGKTAQRLQRHPDAVLKEHPRACPRGTIEGERPHMSVADSGSGWIASLYGVEEERKMRFSERIRSMTNSTGFAIVSTNYMASPYYTVSTNCVVSTNYIFSANYNGLACIQVTVEEYGGQIRTVWFLDPSRSYALLGCKIVMPVSSSEFVVEELIEPAPGVFYPKKVAFYVSRDGKPRSLLTYKGESIVANAPNFSNDIFEIQWPINSMVYDKIHDTQFRITPSLESGKEPVREYYPRGATQKIKGTTN